MEERQSRANILIVDDMPENLELLAAMLSVEDYRVRPAVNGLAALAEVENLVPDLILLDINMPDMDGYQVCEKLKANGQTQDVPVIFLSALTQTQNKVKAFSAGAVDYITKPFHVQEVLARVKTHLTLRAVQRELVQSNTALERLNEDLEQRVEERTRELAQAYDSTLQGWALALELRDHETEGHSQRVTAMTDRLARAMGIRGDHLKQIEQGAVLHDIGKMGVPDSILLKPGSLSDEEWLIMRRHPELARQMLLPIEFLRPALDIPYCHHEKWDGSGYPQGLKGEEIPLAARIFAIVDVWDALGSDRPYRKAWPVGEIQQHIREQAGHHFDPQVVDEFLRILEEG